MTTSLPSPGRRSDGLIWTAAQAKAYLSSQDFKPTAEADPLQGSPWAAHSEYRAAFLGAYCRKGPNDLRSLLDRLSDAHYATYGAMPNREARLSWLASYGVSMIEARPAQRHLALWEYLESSRIVALVDFVNESDVLQILNKPAREWQLADVQALALALAGKQNAPAATRAGEAYALPQKPMAITSPLPEKPEHVIQSRHEALCAVAHALDGWFRRKALAEKAGIDADVVKVWLRAMVQAGFLNKRGEGAASEYHQVQRKIQ